MRRFQLENVGDQSDRFAVVQQREEGYYLEPWVVGTDAAEVVGPYPTQKRALKAAMCWCDQGRVLPLRP